MAIESLQDWQELLSIAHINTIDRNNTPTIIALYQRHINNRYVCPSCPSAVWQALTGLKAYVEQHRKEWELRQAEQDLQDYKGESY